MTREEELRRICEAAGYDEAGIIPPPAGLEIDRTPKSWWKSFDQPNVPARGKP